VASIAKRPDGRYRARYRDHAGKEHARHFDLKRDAQTWLDTQTAALVGGTHVAPRDAKMTVAQWAETWLAGYGTRRPGSVANARSHVALIVEAFGSQQLGTVRPSQVKGWVVALQQRGLSASYVYALHRRLSQLYVDAIADGLAARNPCSRRTSPRKGKQVPYVATTAQVWALHALLPLHLRAAVLLGAFVGLRVSEACGLRVSDVDFMRGIVNPAVQYPAEPLKTDMSRSPVPIPQALALELSAQVQRFPSAGGHLLADPAGRQLAPWMIEHAIRAVRGKVDGLPEGFRYHDLRHHYASVLIASGANVKVVQARLRHASAVTTLDVYGHLFPDTDESTRTAVGAAFADRPADNLRTTGSLA
jgi:integrase